MYILSKEYMMKKKFLYFFLTILFLISYPISTFASNFDNTIQTVPAIAIGEGSDNLDQNYEYKEALIKVKRYYTEIGTDDIVEEAPVVTHWFIPIIYSELPENTNEQIPFLKKENGILNIPETFHLKEHHEFYELLKPQRNPYPSKEEYLYDEIVESEVTLDKDIHLKNVLLANSNPTNKYQRKIQLAHNMVLHGFGIAENCWFEDIDFNGSKIKKSGIPTYDMLTNVFSVNGNLINGLILDDILELDIPIQGLIYYPQAKPTGPKPDDLLNREKNPLTESFMRFIYKDLSKLKKKEIDTSGIDPEEKIIEAPLLQQSGKNTLLNPVRIN